MTAALTAFRREVRAIVPPGAVLHWLRDAASGLILIAALAAIWIGATVLL